MLQTTCRFGMPRIYKSNTASAGAAGCSACCGTHISCNLSLPIAPGVSLCSKRSAVHLCFVSTGRLSRSVSLAFCVV